MRILILNPNSDPQMTAAIEQTAKGFARGAFEVSCRSLDDAPKFIETYRDKLQVGPRMVQLVEAAEDQTDAFIVACHSDPNLDALKEISQKPVVGIGEASMKMATLLGHRFAVITTDRHSIPAKVAQAEKYGLSRDMVSVRAPDKGARYANETELFLALARTAVETDLAEVIVLGCAGLTGLDRQLQRELEVPVLDGVVCALIIASGLVRYGVSTSKVLGYNPHY